MILDNRLISTIEIGNDVVISFGSCQAIFKDVVGMKHAAAKIVPKLLNFVQKQCRMSIAQVILTLFNDDPDLLKKVITGDESWVYDHDIETKAQSYRFAAIEEIKEKSKQELLAMLKSSFRSISWLGTNSGISTLYLNYFERL